MVLHALFGNEQDGCCSHQAAADNVENGGADAAGAGQGSTAVVLNGNNLFIIGIRKIFIIGIGHLILDRVSSATEGVAATVNLNFHIRGQAVEADGSCGFLQEVGAFVQTFNGNIRVCISRKLTGFTLIFSPAGQFVVGIELCVLSLIVGILAVQHELNISQILLVIVTIGEVLEDIEFPSIGLGMSVGCLAIVAILQPSLVLVAGSTNHSIAVNGSGVGYNHLIVGMQRVFVKLDLKSAIIGGGYYCVVSKPFVILFNNDGSSLKSKPLDISSCRT